MPDLATSLFSAQVGAILTGKTLPLIITGVVNLLPNLPSGLNINCSKCQTLFDCLKVLYSVLFFCQTEENVKVNVDYN